jgi:hypothetical protein
MSSFGLDGHPGRNPSSLRVEDFATYPLGGASLAAGHLPLLRALPLVLCVLVLKQIARYDSLFPAEREDLSQLLSMLGSDRLAPTISDFSRISLSEELRRRDWITKPSEFVEQMSTELWSSSQIDDFRHAALQLAPPMEQKHNRKPTLVVVDFDAKLEKQDFVLFRQLKQHGTIFTNLAPSLKDDTFTTSLKVVEDRAKALPVSYSHWVICGDTPPRRPSLAVSAIDYKSLEPVRHNLLDLMSAARVGGMSGPEALGSAMMNLQPAALGITPSDPLAADPLLAQFSVDILGEGSGTQIYSTTFVQWAAREVLRRARPMTALIRFTPRVRQRPTNQQWSRANAESSFDLAGSLIDADMAAYYTWINLNRLAGADSANFVAFHSGRGQAFASGPNLPKGQSSTQVISPSNLLTLVS